MHPLDRKAHCAQPTAYAPLSLLPTSAGQPKLAGTATSHDGPVAPPVAKLQGLIPLPQTVTSISGPLISSQQQRRGAKEANQQDGLGHATLARWGSNVRAELTSKRNARHGGLDFIVSIREGQHGLAQTILLSSAGRAADPGVPARPAHLRRGCYQEPREAAFSHRSVLRGHKGRHNQRYSTTTQDGASRRSERAQTARLTAQTACLTACQDTD